MRDSSITSIMTIIALVFMVNLFFFNGNLFVENNYEESTTTTLYYKHSGDNLESSPIDVVQVIIAVVVIFVAIIFIVAIKFSEVEILGKRPKE